MWHYGTIGLLLPATLRLTGSSKTMETVGARLAADSQHQPEASTILHLQLKVPILRPPMLT